MKMRKLYKEQGNNFLQLKEKNEANAIFGKTIENKSKRIDVRIAAKEKDAIRYNSNPLIKDLKHIGESHIMYVMKKTSYYENKPIIIGMSILESSKQHYYDLYYDYIKPFYGDKVKYLYGDTDSFFLEINKSEEEVKMDFDNELKCIIDSNELGKLKIEAFIEKISIVKSKCYEYTDCSNKKVIKFTGVNKGFLPEHGKITDALLGNKTIKNIEIVKLVSKEHTIKEVKQERKVDFNDDKITIEEDGILCHPLGYIRTLSS